MTRFPDQQCFTVDGQNLTAKTRRAFSDFDDDFDMKNYAATDQRAVDALPNLLKTANDWLIENQWDFERGSRRPVRAVQALGQPIIPDTP